MGSEQGSSGEESPSVMTLRWDKGLGVPITQQTFTDVEGVGRYLIRKVKHQREYRVYLNGVRTSYVGDTMDQAKAMVESIIKAKDAAS